MSEHGKTHGEALGSIQKGNETCEWATSIPQVIQGRTQEVSGGVTCSESRESLGIVACIVPFNFPIMVPFWTLPIAIAAGNCVILKPSEKVPRTMQKVRHNTQIGRCCRNSALSTVCALGDCVQCANPPPFLSCLLFLLL